MKLLRTNYLGELSLELENKQIVVSGFVNKNRDLGDLIFIDLRDITGMSQIVVNNDYSEFENIKILKKESVISVRGTLVKRTDVNENMKTGNIEIIANEIEVINTSNPTPIDIVNDLNASEETRLKFRYLDLRREVMQKKLITRHKVVTSIREYLNKNMFIDIETPILTASTPEGARDYLVPSRVNNGQFYALPQSPQIYKNLLMIGGYERYYQVVKCFRDEDLRADRQPEFTQVDIEMSFMSEQQIRDLSEKMIKKVVFDIKGIDFKEKFMVMDYMDAMNQYGVDKPDIRFYMKIIDAKEIFINSEFSVFKNAKNVRFIALENGFEYSRKDIDKLEALAKKHHAKGLAWLKYKEGIFTGPIVKFLGEMELNQLKKHIKNNSLLLFVADEFNIVCSALGALRTHLGKVHHMYDENELSFLWITNWPMFEYDQELDRLFAVHHPFTYPKDGKFQDNPIDTKACAYDLVLNGYELGGGSIRINNPELLNEMFVHLKMEQSEIDEKFGFLIDAYKYGAPYHGGIAFGLDRLCMLLTNSESIRDVIAFPKNNQARELMIHSPSYVSEQQLKELSVKVIND